MFVARRADAEPFPSRIAGNGNFFLELRTNIVTLTSASIWRCKCGSEIRRAGCQLDANDEFCKSDPDLNRGVRDRPEHGRHWISKARTARRRKRTRKYGGMELVCCLQMDARANGPRKARSRQGGEGRVAERRAGEGAAAVLLGSSTHQTAARLSESAALTGLRLGRL